MALDTELPTAIRFKLIVLAHHRCKGWFTRTTQMQTQEVTRVNYRNANANASTSADARNGKMFIFFHLHFTRVNRASSSSTVRIRIRSIAGTTFYDKNNQQIPCHVSKYWPNPHTPSSILPLNTSFSPLK